MVEFRCSPTKYIPDFFTTHQDVVVRSDRPYGYCFRTSALILASHSKWCKEILEPHFASDEDVCLVISGASSDCLRRLEMFLHDGSITFPETEEDFDSQVENLKQEFQILDLFAPDAFWMKDNSSLERMIKREDSHSPVDEEMMDDDDDHDDTDEFEGNGTKDDEMANNSFGGRMDYYHPPRRSPPMPRRSSPVQRRPPTIAITPTMPRKDKGDPSAKFVSPQSLKIIQDVKRQKEVKNKKPDFTVWKCPDCSKTFTGTIPAFKRHLEHHKKIRQDTPFACDRCSAAYAEPAALEEHQATAHVVDETEICHMCGNVCKDRNDLQRHMKRNHGQTFKCEFCGKAFISEYRVKTHVTAVHTADIEKPYRCEICGKGYGRKGSLKEHIMIHEDRKQYKCRVCPYATNNLSNRNKHERIKHKELLHLIRNPDHASALAAAATAAMQHDAAPPMVPPLHLLGGNPNLQ